MREKSITLLTLFIGLITMSSVNVQAEEYDINNFETSLIQFNDFNKSSILEFNTVNSTSQEQLNNNDLPSSIYIEDNSSTNLQYTVSVSQDNWVYAPNDIYRSGKIYSEYSLIKDSVSINEYYIPDDIMYEIFRLYNDNSNQVEYWVKDEQYNNVENYLLKIQDNKLENDEALENRFNNVDAKFIINCLNQGYEAYINNLDSLGIDTTVGGIILMKVPFLGTGATLIGGGITYLNEKNDIMYKNLVDALVKGKYNIVIKNNELNFNFYLKDNFEFSSWNKKNMSINIVIIQDYK